MPSTGPRQPTRRLFYRLRTALFRLLYRLWTGHEPPEREPGDEGMFG